MTMLDEGLPDPLPDLSDGSDSGLDCECLKILLWEVVYHLIENFINTMPTI